MILEYLMITLAGFLGSYHCIGMCGAIPSIISYKNFWIGNILYNMGRIFTYSFLGFLAGMLGMYFHKFEFQIIQKGLSIFAGVMIILFGLQITGNIKEKGVPFLDVVFESISDLYQILDNLRLFLECLTAFCMPLVYAFLMKLL